MQPLSRVPPASRVLTEAIHLSRPDMLNAVVISRIL